LLPLFDYIKQSSRYFLNQKNIELKEMTSRETVQDHKAEQYLQRREQNITKNMAPSLTELQSNLGPLLSRVVVSQMSPMAKQIMNVSKPPISHTERTQNLTHYDILSIGAVIEEKSRREQQFLTNQAISDAVAEAIELEK
jgi:hypothetical protein